MTAAAKQFVSPLSAAALSGARVRFDLFSLIDEAEMGHIELSRSADLVVVAPATADLLARMAHGLADDLASTTLLATDKRVLVAPAMNVRMWLHPATQRNVATLQGGRRRVRRARRRRNGVRRIRARAAWPSRWRSSRRSSALAVADRDSAAAPRRRRRGALAGRRVVVTSGPTYEPIDPVRFIGNRSSGLQGHAIAEAARARGRRVTLVSGPVALADPAGVRSCGSRRRARCSRRVDAALPADVFVAAAAVADWRVEDAAKQKIKKGADGAPMLALVENPDILADDRRAAAIGRRSSSASPPRPSTLIDNARAKLEAQGLRPDRRQQRRRGRRDVRRRREQSARSSPPTASRHGRA